MSLTEPTAKMSKSHPSARSRILLTDSAEYIKQKIAGAVTDSIPQISYDTAKRPGISNLLDILSIFDQQKRTPQELGQFYSDLSAKLLKDMVSDAVILGLEKIRLRYLDLLATGEDHLNRIEAEGARKAKQSAHQTMEIVRAAVGF